MTKKKDDVEKISSNIRKIRINLGLTQKDFAEVLNVSRSAVTRWENGSRVPTPEILVKISRLTQQKANDLLTSSVSEAEESVSDYAAKQRKVVDSLKSNYNKLNGLHQLDGMNEHQLFELLNKNGQDQTLEFMRLLIRSKNSDAKSQVAVAEIVYKTFAKIRKII